MNHALLLPQKHILSIKSVFQDVKYADEQVRYHFTDSKATHVNIVFGVQVHRMNILYDLKYVLNIRSLKLQQIAYLIYGTYITHICHLGFLRSIDNC